MTRTPRPNLPEIARRAIGRRSDWYLHRRPASLPRFRASWLGSLVVAASVLVGWFAFAGAVDDDGGSVQYGLWVGSASIVLMAWSFVLALRPRSLERVFGGLDRMYRVHRWAGSLAVVAMFLHTQAEPEVEGGVRGAARSLADSAEDLAGVGEILLYVLVGISLLRWIPYRYWRWTHKFLGVPFAFASWHFFTAEKTYANNSPWGWWFGTIMVLGLVAYLLRVIGRDMLRPGVRYRVTGIDRQGSTSEIRLAPVNRPLRHEAGQFSVLKLRVPGLREPHVFTIASGPDEPEIRFFIRDLGDWTGAIQDADRQEAALRGAEAVIEGPYGHFRPRPATPGPTLWIAGGVGITPFLSSLSAADTSAAAEPPLLLYCVRDRRDATALPLLEHAAAEGRITLEVFESSTGRRFSAERLAELTTSLRGTHVAVCGPASLVAAASSAARTLGAPHIETELFDIRGGFGPDLSRTFDELISPAG